NLGAFVITMPQAFNTDWHRDIVEHVQALSVADFFLFVNPFAVLRPAELSASLSAACFVTSGSASDAIMWPLAFSAGLSCPGRGVRAFSATLGGSSAAGASLAPWAALPRVTSARSAPARVRTRGIDGRTCRTSDSAAQASAAAVLHG